MLKDPPPPKTGLNFWETVHVIWSKRWISRPLRMDIPSLNRAWGGLVALVWNPVLPQVFEETWRACSLCYYQYYGAYLHTVVLNLWVAGGPGQKSSTVVFNAVWCKVGRLALRRGYRVAPWILWEVIMWVAVREGWEALTYYSQQKTAGISIFCDGSWIITCITGCRYMIKKREEILEMRAINLDSRNSVYQAEVCAIKSAIDTLRRRRGSTDVTLYSDSQSVLVSLRKFFQSKLLKACINSLNTVGRDRKVTLCVKAHVGHPGNELADELARTGAKLGDELKVDDIKISCPHSYVKEIIKKGFTQKWNLRWSLLRECRQMKIWLPGVSSSKSAEILCCNRDNLSWLVQLIMGHNKMKQHELLIDPSLSPTCQKCQEDDESSIHV